MCFELCICEYEETATLPLELSYQLVKSNYDAYNNKSGKVCIFKVKLKRNKVFRRFMKL